MKFVPSSSGRETNLTVCGGCDDGLEARPVAVTVPTETVHVLAYVHG
jgi:hypothetical protein